jgi:hypothetical protein
VCGCLRINLDLNIKWYLKKREKVDHEAVQMVYAWQMEIFRLEQECDATEDEGLIDRNKKLIKEYTAKANAIRKHLVYFSDMKAYENLATLGEFYFKRQRRIAAAKWNMK